MMELSYSGTVIIGDFYNKPIGDVNKFLNAVSSDTVVFLCLSADKRTNIEGGAYKKSLSAIVNNPQAVCYLGNVDLNIFNVITGKFENNVFVFKKSVIEGFFIKDVNSFLVWACEKQLVHIDEDNQGVLNYEVKSNRLSDHAKIHGFDFGIVIPTRGDYVEITKKCGIQNLRYNTHWLMKNDRLFGFKNTDDLPTNILTYDHEFNYSRIHNDFFHTVNYRRYYVLMNDDVECNEDSIRNLLIPFMFDAKLAVVGARLCFPNGTIQHAGVRIDRRLGAMHPGRGLPDSSEYDCFDTQCCVTFALVAIDVMKYCQLGGMDENLPYDFNDIDYCLRCKKAGYRVLYNPQVKAVHHESVTRKAEGKCGVKADMEYFKNKHKELFR